MIAFLTLFLGLVTGVQPVELTVTDPQVMAVELRLDGRTVGVLRGAPWILTCDFGEELAPHELVAMGLNDAGEVVGEARQWINLPRRRAEVELVLERDGAKLPRAARLVWSSVDVARPDSVTLTFDGEELLGVDPARFDLPDYDPNSPHLLQANVQMGEAEVQAQVVVGASGTEVSQELTAVPLYLPEGRDRPTVAEMEGWLEARGELLRVVAVESAEKGGADVIVVEDLAWWLQGRLKRLRGEALSVRAGVRGRPTGLKSKDQLRLLFPIPTAATAAATRSLQFPMSPNLWRGQVEESFARGATDRQVAEARPQGLLLALPVNGEQKIDTSNQRLTDAVAVGALSAAQGQRGRVLLLVAGSEERDLSRHTPEEVRAYLARLNVPLRVWSPVPEKVAQGWGEVENIANRARLYRAIQELRTFLDRQVVVWVEGRYLPQQIRLTEAAAGRLVPLSEVGPPPPSFQDEGEDFDDGLMVAEGELPELAPRPPSPPSPAGAATENSAAPTPPQPAAATTPFVDTVQVNVVNVDVVVTDPDGLRVRGLTKDDFALFEDGEPMEITYFEAPPPLPAASETATGEETPEAASSVASAPAPRPMSLVIYLDLFHLNSFQRRKSLRELKAHLEDQDGPVRIMVVAYDGKVEIPLTFTENREAVVAALAAVEAKDRRMRRDSFRGALREMGEIRNAIDTAHRIRDPLERRMAVTSALSQRSSLEGLLRGVAIDRMQEVKDLVASLERFALGLSGVEGRRALLYVGDRLSISPGEEIYDEAANLMADTTALAHEITGVSEASRQSRLHSEGSKLNLYRDFEKMLRETSATGTTFYTLTPPNLDDTDNTWRASPGTMGSQGRIASARNEAVKTAACLMSDETGGLCQVGGTEMSLLLEATFEDFGAYYSLAFTPDRDPDGKFHKIKVEVQDPDRKLRVRYREGYLDRPREDLVRDRLIAALTFGEEQDNLALQLLVEEPQPMEKAGLVLLPLEVRVLAQRLGLLPEPGTDKRRAQARLLVTTMNEDGRTTGIQEYPIRFVVGKDRLASGKPLLYAQKVHLTLQEGEQILAVGFWDEIGRVGSFVRREVNLTALNP